MNKNSGFTLVELLAVIVVLGLLLTLAVPKIKKVMNESKRKAFLGEAQAVYRTAKMKALDLANEGNGGVIYSKGLTKLDMKGNKLDYCVIVDETATITSITVSNGTYIVSGDSNFMSLDVTSVTNGNMNSFVCE